MAAAGGDIFSLHKCRFSCNDRAMEENPVNHIIEALSIVAKDSPQFLAAMGRIQDRHGIKYAIVHKAKRNVGEICTLKFKTADFAVSFIQAAKCRKEKGDLKITITWYMYKPTKGTREAAAIRLREFFDELVVLLGLPNT